MPWKNPFYNPKLAHHRADGFCNPDGLLHQPTDLRRWRAERKAQKLPRPPQNGYAAFVQRWWQHADFNQPPSDGAWWLGHASLLLQINRQFLLTDPVFSRRASPVSFLGPARKTPLPCPPDELPDLAAVLISHNHYDHLDRATVRYLHKRFPDLLFLVPLGLKSWFQRLGIQHVTELDWWQQINWQGLTLHCVPARHWSMRNLWDRNRSLWCGWLVESDSVRFWFSGDTGYTPELLQIPQRIGTITTAALPIGAYQPRWFMALHHMDPQNAVRLWQQLGRPQAIPIHWGVFELADESLDMPVYELQTALQQQGENTQDFAPLMIGGYLPLRQSVKRDP